MTRTILITSGQVAAEATLSDSACAERIWRALPIAATASRWGQEVYFDIGVACDLDSGARAAVKVGELGYWPTGEALCIFFGRTPASGPDGQPRAASAVNVVGEVVGQASVFEAVKAGQEIVISAKT